MKTKILLIYTGGTIGMVKDYDSGVLKPFNFNELLQRIPELYQLDCNIDTLSFDSPIDSSDMHPRDWLKIASIIEDGYENYDGFVVLHGSDTMSYTASALSFLLENLDKPVIFTGSQLPIGDLRTDAKENLITSIQIASLRQSSKSVVREVGLYFEYKLYRGNRTTKINAEIVKLNNEIDKNKNLKELDHGLLTIKEKSLPEKLKKIAIEFSALLKETKPDIAGVETLFFSTNKKTAFEVAHARGLLLHLLNENNIPIHEFTPNQVKTAATGYGNADKIMVAKMVAKILNLPTIEGDDNTADALAVAITTANHLQIPS